MLFSQMISVERVMEYTELEREAPWESNKSPPPEWPSDGVIAFQNVNFTYSFDGPLVLRHLSALIKSKEKVRIWCLYFHVMKLKHISRAIYTNFFR